jgi:hypothetical protein
MAKWEMLVIYDHGGHVSRRVHGLMREVGPLSLQHMKPPNIEVYPNEAHLNVLHLDKHDVKVVTDFLSLERKLVVPLILGNDYPGG